MKKSILFTAVALGFVFGANAQNERTIRFTAPKLVKESENAGSQVNKVYNHNPSTQAIGCDTIGKSANAFGSYSRGSRSLVYADPNLNTIIFTHRATASPGSGYIQYDISTNGGSTWNRNVGPVYSPTGNPGRYPQGVIYNPPSNTNPASAFFATHGPVLNGSTWFGYQEAYTPLTTLAPMQQVDTFNTTAYPFEGLIPYCMYYVQNTGDVWIADMGFNGSDYTDSLIIRHGVWAANKYVYTTTKFAAPTSNQATTNSEIFSDVTMAFNKTGTTGYIVMVGNMDNPIVDSTYNLIVYQTTNAGVTWSGPTTVCIDNLDVALNTGLGSPIFTIVSGADGGDAVVDANNNLHVIIAAGPASSNGLLGYFDGTPGRWGIFDFYTQNATVSATGFKAQLLYKPQTFSGDFNGNTANAITLANRPQATTNWNGDRLFFTWFDTDTLTFAGQGNTYPDAWGAAYNVTTGKWSPVTNLTGDFGSPTTCASGAVTFGSCPQFALSPGAGTWNVPLVYQFLTGGLDATMQVQHTYVSGIQWLDNQMTQNSTAIAACIAGGVHDQPNNLFAVSNSYPNPFSGSANINITMKKAGVVTIDILNTLGEKVANTVTSELSAGQHQMTIDASKLSSGIYFYSVKCGEFTVSRKLVIE